MDVIRLPVTQMVASSILGHATQIVDLCFSFELTNKKTVDFKG